MNWPLGIFTSSNMFGIICSTFGFEYHRLKNNPISVIQYVTENRK